MKVKIRNFATVRIAKNILNSFLAITLLIATTGVTLNKHYCMGRLKSLAVFEHAQNCTGSEMQDPMPCCEDVSEELKVEEITTIAFDFDASPDLYELANINHALLEDISSVLQQDRPEFINYDPPLPDRDIPVLTQSFLI